MRACASWLSAVRRACGRARHVPCAWLWRARRVPVFLDTITHVIALVVAMLVQRVVSAIVSGLRGGFMASQTAIRFTNEMGYSKIDEETSLIDESAGLLIAACGITFQLMQGFALPFPFNLLLLPVVIFEYVLQWQVTFQNDYKA